MTLNRAHFIKGGIISRGVGLQKTKTRRKNKLELAQIERPSDIDAKRSLPIEADGEIELIDLSSLTNTNPKEEAELSSLNYRISPRHPVKWWINEAGGSWKEYPDGSIELTGDHSGCYRELYLKCDTELKCDICSIRRPPYKTITGEKVNPTRIISLLSQNLDSIPRPASTFFWWKQSDEGHYIAKAKEGLTEFIAATRENYYFVPENSRLRPKFRCPEIGISIKDSGRIGDDDDDYGVDLNKYGVDLNKYGEAWTDRPIYADLGPIQIYVNPKNDQAVFYCPRCSKAKSKRTGGDGKGVKHTIQRELRDELAKEGIISPKRYKYHDRLSESGKLLDFIRNNQGMSFYELDQAMGWDSDGRISKRIINKQLKDKVELRKGRKGNKGYKIYINH